MNQKNKKYLLKKGPADPFRGDWYTDEQSFTSAEEAVAKAAALTLTDRNSLMTSWEQYGYEWSVFELIDGIEKKIWEGYKYIKSSSGDDHDISSGYIE